MLSLIKNPVNHSQSCILLWTWEFRLKTKSFKITVLTSVLWIKHRSRVLTSVLRIKHWSRVITFVLWIKHWSRVLTFVLWIKHWSRVLTFVLWISGSSLDIHVQREIYGLFYSSSIFRRPYRDNLNWGIKHWFSNNFYVISRSSVKINRIHTQILKPYSFERNPRFSFFLRFSFILNVPHSKQTFSWFLKLWQFRWYICSDLFQFLTIIKEQLFGE